MSEEENWEGDIGKMPVWEACEALNDESHPHHEAVKRYQTKVATDVASRIASIQSEWNLSPGIEKLRKSVADYLPTQVSNRKKFQLPGVDITKISNAGIDSVSALAPRIDVTQQNPNWSISDSEPAQQLRPEDLRDAQIEIKKAIEEASAAAIELAKESAKRGKETLDVLKILTDQIVLMNDRLDVTNTKLAKREQAIAKENKQTGRTNLIMILLATATLTVSLASLFWQLQ